VVSAEVFLAPVAQDQPFRLEPRGFAEQALFLAE
jgi:hypothetical protein